MKYVNFSHMSRETILTFAQAIVAALEPPAPKKKSRHCRIL